MKEIKATELNKQMIEKYDLPEFFNCITTLYGSAHTKGNKYLLKISQEKLEHLEEFASECFESYVTNSIKIMRNLLEQGYEGEVLLTDE